MGDACGMLTVMEYGVVIGAGLALVGLVIGSFMGAQIWRIRARHVAELREVGEDYDKKEYKALNPLLSRSARSDRSLCLHCSHQLAWYDLVPLVSWLSTGGKCRYCHKSIGIFEPLIEFGTAVFFVISFLAWPSALTVADPWQIVQFATWLIAGCLLVMLFVYDLKWKLLPDSIVFPLMFVAGVLAEFHLVQSNDIGAALLSLNGAILILSGFYFALYMVAERLGRQWIGFGDVKLGFALALMLADWKLAFLALFLANIIGSVVIVALISSKLIGRHTMVPFGPFFIVGAVIAGLWGQSIIDWYISLLGA